MHELNTGCGFLSSPGSAPAWLHDWNLPEQMLRAGKSSIEAASRVIVVAGHIKFGRGGMIPVASLNAAHTVVSDAEPGSEYAVILRDNGIEALLA